MGDGERIDISVGFVGCEVWGVGGVDCVSVVAVVVVCWGFDGGAKRLKWKAWSGASASASGSDLRSWICMISVLDVSGLMKSYSNP